MPTDIKPIEDDRNILHESYSDEDTIAASKEAGKVTILKLKTTRLNFLQHR
jgi:hypothetical protein